MRHLLVLHFPEPGVVGGAVEDAGDGGAGDDEGAGAEDGEEDDEGVG